MNKLKIFIIIFLIFIIIGIIAFWMFNGNFNNNYEPNPSDATKISTNINSTYEQTNSKNSISSNIVTIKEISIFSTQIKDKSSGRLKNISITCDIINNTIISSGDTFSFNEIVGKPTIERGYEEAPVIIDHKTEQGIGGGNCQVSSTIYNAVLAVPSLEVKERHEHGKDVGYVPKGKDAAVSYDSLDLKFKNNSNSSIKIECSSDNENIVVRLIEI